MLSGTFPFFFSTRVSLPLTSLQLTTQPVSRPTTQQKIYIAQAPNHYPDQPQREGWHFIVASTYAQSIPW